MPFGFVKDTLFGKDPKVKQKSTMSKEQRGLMNKTGIPTVQKRVTQGPADFKGDMVSDITGGEQDVLGNIQRLLGQTAEGGGAALSGAGQNALQRLLQGNAPEFDQYFQQSVQEPLMRQFEQDILPALSREFAGQGAGSERALATGRAGGDLASTLASERAGMAFNTQQSALDRMMQGVGLDMQAQGQQFDQQTGALQQQVTGLQALGLPRAIEDQRKKLQYGDFLRKQDEEARRIQELLAMLGIGTSENIAFGGTTGIAQEFLSGAAQGAGGALGTMMGGG